MVFTDVLPGAACGTLPGDFWRRVDDAAARTALELLLAGQEPDAEGFAALQSTMLRYLAAAWPAQSHYELEDVADEALTRLLLKSRQQSLGELADPLPYLLRTARNEFLSRRRRKEVVGLNENVPEDQEAVEDRQLLRLLDEQASLSEFQDALRIVTERGDATSRQVLLTWLDKANECDGDPSDTMIGEALGIHATTVARALERLRKVLIELRATDQPSDG